jgi:serine/threonine protein phosphatase PrpC
MDWASITYPGTRQVNEDSVGVAEGQSMQCFIVADGLGGHGKGEVASQLAVAAFKKVFEEENLPPEASMHGAFDRAQQDILEEQNRAQCPMQMKTTVAALAVTDKEILWGHIGDTRLYQFRFHWVRKRTLDHSVPQMLVDAREIKEKEIRNHPDRNKLLRVLGVSGDTPRYVLSGIKKRRRNQAFLLCTDGFWELVLEKEMENCLKNAKSAQHWLDQMAQIVKQRGEGKAMDNYSAIAVIL